MKFFVSATYLGAHLGAKSRESNPNYETEKDLGRGHRRIKKRTISSDEEESESPSQPVHSASLPSPPKVKAAGGSKMFKPVMTSLKVVGPSTSGNRQKMPVRRDKGSKGSSLLDITAIIQARKDAAKEKKSSTVETPPSRKVRRVEEKLVEERPESHHDDSCDFPVENEPPTAVNLANSSSAKSPSNTTVARNLFGASTQKTAAELAQKSLSQIKCKYFSHCLCFCCVYVAPIHMIDFGFSFFTS